MFFLFCRLYSSAVFNHCFDDHLSPEIINRPVDDLVLQMKVICQHCAVIIGYVKTCTQCIFLLHSYIHIFCFIHFPMQILLDHILIDAFVSSFFISWF